MPSPQCKLTEKDRIGARVCEPRPWTIGAIYWQTQSTSGATFATWLSNLQEREARCAIPNYSTEKERSFKVARVGCALTPALCHAKSSVLKESLAKMLPKSFFLTAVIAQLLHACEETGKYFEIRPLCRCWRDGVVAETQASRLCQAVDCELQQPRICSLCHPCRPEGKATKDCA